MNFTTSGINGTIKEWNGTKGTLQSDTASGKDKTFWFDKSNIVVPRYSAAYEPKVGDWVTSTALPDDDTRVDRVMQSIRMLPLTQGHLIIVSNETQVNAWLNEFRLEQTEPKWWRRKRSRPKRNLFEQSRA